MTPDEPDEILADEVLSDDTRHFKQDPDGLADNHRDADEQEAADVLEVDQTELEELGLVLDDPHAADPTD
jgi:hypothetical protein